MKFTLSWLKEHLDTTASAEEIANTAADGFADGMAGLRQNAREAFSGQSEGYGEQVGQLVASAITLFGCAISGMLTSMTSLLASLTEGVNAQKSSLTTSFDAQTGEPMSKTHEAVEDFVAEARRRRTGSRAA